MKTVTKSIFPIILLSLVVSCGDGKKMKTTAIEEKKTELGKLRNQRVEIDKKIGALEDEIAQSDSSFSMQKPALVTVAPVTKADFRHYLTLQGVVSAQNVSYITPAGQPGQIKAIYVKEGDRVSRGSLILKLDNSVITENVNAVRQQMSTVQVQLDLAKSVYERQKNLWDHNIGTEIQLLEAKTNMEALQGQLKTIQANAKALEVQANQSNVYSDINGTVDEVTARVGETFTGNPLSGGYVKVVSRDNMKVTVIVPESYAGKVFKGSSVAVDLPDSEQSFTGHISFISQTIGASNRGFNVEVKVPSNIPVKSNQTAIIRILDYHNPNTISIPLNVVQNDLNGKFVMTAINENGQLIARKIPVRIGRFSSDSVEIKEGLQPGDMIITGGYQNLFDKQLLTTNGK